MNTNNVIWFSHKHHRKTKKKKGERKEKEQKQSRFAFQINMPTNKKAGSVSKYLPWVLDTNQ